MYITSKFVLPQNSIKTGLGPCGLGSQATSLRAIVPVGQRLPSGVLTRAPLNGTLKGLTYPSGYPQSLQGISGLAGDCKCHGSCGSCKDHSHGLGEFSLDSIMSSLNAPSPIFDLPWLYVAGIGLVAYMMLSRVDGDEYKYQKAKARRDYASKLKELKEEHPSRARHAGQHLRSGYERTRGLFS